MESHSISRDAIIARLNDANMVSFAPHSLPTDLADLAVSSDDMPWVPNGQGLAFKPLHYSPSTGMWINLIRCERKGRISRHLHTGGSVHGYVLQGSWRYIEHDWVATPRTLRLGAAR